MLLLIKKNNTMLKKISRLKGVQPLKKAQQKDINGGFDPYICPGGYRGIVQCLNGQLVAHCVLGSPPIVISEHCF
ncbi:hypothetical protein GCM10011344_33730 [Dokdonia pacifica]|nr:hypothetical protein GCM10011344_33730 [Dokdonia pacifica]